MATFDEVLILGFEENPILLPERRTRSESRDLGRCLFPGTELGAASTEAWPTFATTGRIQWPTTPKASIPNSYLTGWKG